MLGILDITGGLKTRSNALRVIVWRRQNAPSPLISLHVVNQLRVQGSPVGPAD
jgi:hypothetical protein